MRGVSFIGVDVTWLFWTKRFNRQMSAIAIKRTLLHCT